MGPSPTPSPSASPTPRPTPTPSPTSGCGGRGIVASLTLALCTFIVTHPPGAIERREAIRIARSHLSARGRLDRAELATYVFSTGERVDWAWLVRFYGDFPKECVAPPRGLACHGFSLATVVLDHTGEFITTDYE
ncbi:MAG TPA: hypothetical protein VEX62_07630 [Candidatus Limnocylindrales bacterium]|nr:hypothetical protein [Candidatus Limnocylindrales bacterium]